MCAGMAKSVRPPLAIEMNDKVRTGPKDEQALIRLYMDLTGSSEANARSVFMYVCPANPQTNGLATQMDDENHPEDEVGNPTPPPRSPHLALVLGALLGLGFGVAGALAEPPAAPANSLPTRPLSLADAVNFALSQSPNILRAQKDLEAAEGVVIQTRAIAIPKVAITGSYQAVEPSDVDTFSASSFLPTNVNSGFTFGTDQNWVSQIRLVQSLYEGGRMLSSFRVGRLLREQSLLNYQTTVANTVLDVQIAYDDVLLAAQQIVVQEASIELLSRELADTTRRFDAGTVPRFNVLRAEVELANARPRLIRARNSLRIAKNNLANLLGFNLPPDTDQDIPLTLSGRLDAEPYPVELSQAIAQALERRTELGALRKARALRQEDVVNAKAGYKPSLQAFAGYDVHNSLLHSDISFEDHGWITGVQASWNLFDGWRTRGRIKEATAQYERAGIELDDAGRRIELDVRTTFSNFTEAQEVLKSQEKVVEEAEEALRLAQARSEAGTSTQLDVLGAQTSLTEARTTQIQALHDYAVARARLERAVGANLPAPPKTP
jgi:outer membrane protein